MSIIELKLAKAIRVGRQWFKLTSLREAAKFAVRRVDWSEAEKQEAVLDYATWVTEWVIYAYEQGFRSESEIADFLFSDPDFRETFPAKHEEAYRIAIRVTLEWMQNDD